MLPLSYVRAHSEDMGMIHFDCPRVQFLSRQDLKADHSTVLTGHGEGQQSVAERDFLSWCVCVWRYVCGDEPVLKQFLGSFFLLLLPRSSKVLIFLS